MREVIKVDSTVEQQYLDNPDGTLSPLGAFIFYSKYSRWLDKENRRENWVECCKRSLEYNMNLAIEHLQKEGKPITEEFIQEHEKELADLFENQVNLKQFVSGRTLWTGGTEASRLNPMSNFNCAFMIMNEWNKLAELIHLGMVGTGIGVRILKSDVEKIPPLKYHNVPIIHEDINPVEPQLRRDITKIEKIGNSIRIIIGDSKEGWVASVSAFFESLLGVFGEIDKISINYDSIRPAGEKLKRFGGRAGGAETIKGMYEKFDKIIKGELTEGYPIMKDGKPQPIHMLDLSNAVARNIVSGDVRSIAEIGLLDANDLDTINAKIGIHDKPELYHRYMSNNSIFYETKPTREQLDWQFKSIEENGEPCFINAEVGRKRREDFEGVNPCVEILLSDRGLCNLTTVNIMGFVKENKGIKELDCKNMFKAFRLATRAGMRMTLPDLELEEWDKVQKRDRLIGVSMTGYQDAMDAIGVGHNMEFQSCLLRCIREEVHEEMHKYAKTLGINVPKLATCVKPEGTISQLAGGVSSGIHVAHSTYFMRRVRSAVKDPITKVVFDLGWRVHAEYSDLSDRKSLCNLLEIGQPTDYKIEKYTSEDGMFNVVFETDYSEDFLDKINKTLSNKFGVGKFNIMSLATTEDKLKFNIMAITRDFDLVFGECTKVVVEFPMETPATRTKYNVSAIEQMEIYKMFLHEYTDHNPSNTINVRPHEWESVKEWVYENWDDTLAVSFLGLIDFTYPLLPYEACEEADVKSLQSIMKPFNAEILKKYDRGEDMTIIDAGCESGACPVR